MIIYLKRNHCKFVALFLLLLLNGYTASSQEEVLKAIQTKLVQYNENALQEKVYVHTDKNFYLAGEIVWLKAYNVDGFYNKPLQLSKVVYVDILDKNNKPVEQRKISLEAEGESGSIQLPLTLNSGNYKLRAYTNWMKNFSADVFFEKIITIVNPLKDPETAATPSPSPSYTIDLFPEGGNLVRGLESKVAFKVTDQYGKGVEGKGVVVNENNETIAEFSTLKFGIGNFKFTPLPNQTYKAVVTLADGSKINKSFPAIYEQGYVMTVSEGDKQHLKISVQTNIASGTPYAQNIYLFAHTRQIFKIAERSTFNNGTAVFYVDKSKLGEGVTQFTIFNADRQPLCERMYFIKPSNNFTISAGLNNQQYTPRQNVNVSVETKDKSGKINPANISMSVFKYDSLQNFDGMNIQNYLWLTSELTGTVESPAYYFSTGNEVDAAVDNLMLTHGWRRFKWENILGGKKISFQNPPELNGHIITAKVIDTRNNQPANGVMAFLSIPGNQFQFYTAKSNASGIVHFDIKNYYGAGEVMLQTNTEKDSFYRIDILTPFSEEYTSTTMPAFKIPAAVTLLEKYSIGMQTQNVYSSDSIRQFIAPYIQDTLPFFGTAQYSYMLDNYTRFTTMEEVLREYVRPINVSLRNGKLYLRIFDEPRKEFNENELLVLLDGIPIFDKQKIFSYDPHKIKRLDIIPRGYFIGQASFKGVASFVTYNGNYEGLELDRRLLSVDYEGLQIQREFYSPEYQTKEQLNSRIPDFRTTLFWTPKVNTGDNGQAEVSFYTSDKEGTYMVVLEGMDAAGRPAATTFTFEVKK